MNDVSTFIWMGGFVLHVPMQKSEGILSGGFCPEGVLSYIPNNPASANSIKVRDNTNYFNSS